MLTSFINRTGFPSGRGAGFNPGHFAAGPNPRFSGVAMNGNVVNLLKAAKGTIHGSISSGINNVGPYVGTTADLNYLSYTAANEKPTAVTFAAIMVATTLPAPASSALIICNNGNSLAGASTGLIINNFGSGVIVPAIFNGGSSSPLTSSATMATNVPYFMALSATDNVVINAAILNLSTGKMFAATGSFSGSHFGTPTQSAYNLLGDNAGASFQIDGNLTAVMYSLNNQLSLAQLVKWANNPWDYWYPPTVSSIMSMIGPKGVSVTPRAPFNLPFLGW